MARPTNVVRMQNQLDAMMSVKELRQYLDRFPDKMKVGCMGHFGEFLPMRTLPREVKVFHGLDGWRSEERTYMDVVELYLPDPGPDPE